MKFNLRWNSCASGSLAEWNRFDDIQLDIFKPSDDFELEVVESDWTITVSNNQIVVMHSGKHGDADEGTLKFFPLV